MSQPTLTVRALDHFVLTVADIAATLAFYQHTLGMQAEKFKVRDGSARWALKFGDMKINLHQQGAEFEPKSAHPTPGSADLCFLSEAPLVDWITHLERKAVIIEDGPVARTGATCALTSIYIRDPDQNLIEIAVAS